MNAATSVMDRAARMRGEPVEAQIAKLQSDVEHMRSDITEMKVDIRRLDDKIGRLDDKIESVRAYLDAKIDALRNDLHSTKIWALLLYFAQSAVLLGVMAKGFGWLN
jgi:outer membrane murein-binding lipoprotein Lpp